MQGLLHKDMASTVMCNLSPEMALNSTLDGHQPGFIHLRLKAEAALNGMFDHYQHCRNHCVVAATIHKDSLLLRRNQICFEARHIISNERPQLNGHTTALCYWHFYF